MSRSSRSTTSRTSARRPRSRSFVSRVVAKPNLERHAAFEHPQPRLGRLQPGENPFEEHSSSQPIEADPGGLRPSHEAILKSDA